jgi:tetratricopeptide (TPR) repeat protein
MADELTARAASLLRDARDRVRDGRDGPRLEDVLVELSRCAPSGSAAWTFAVCELAERRMSREPWQAAVLARRATQARPDEHRGWGLLGLAQSLLGHHRFAVRAYDEALRLQPSNPWYAHNLGHLYDVALAQPKRALPLLRTAREVLAGWSEVPGVDLGRARQEVTASLAHALLGIGEPARAREVMRDLMRGAPRPAHHELYAAILAAEEEALAVVANQPPDSTSTPTRRRRVVRRARTATA